MKYIFLLLVLAGCANKTFVMPMPTTYPEERKVQTSYPVVPVQIREL